jgi:hypothetical protein
MSNPDRGDEDAPLLIILPFEMSEPTMKWLYTLLKHDCQIDMADVRILHLLHEEPAGANLRPTALQVRTALPRFRKAVEASYPKVIVPMGPDAVKAIMGIQPSSVGIEDCRGYVLDKTYQGVVLEGTLEQVGSYANKNKIKGIEKGDPKYKTVVRSVKPPLPLRFSGHIIPAYSPIQVQKSGYTLTWAFKADLDRAARAVRDELNVVNKDLQFFTSLDEPGARNIYTGDMVAFDIETMGIGSRVVDCISFSDGKRTHTLKWTSQIRQWCNTLFAQPNIMFIGHNLAFDMPILRDAGIVFPDYFRYWDTMFAGVMLQPDLMKGLGKMAPLYLDIKPWKWRHLSEADPALYSAMDSYVTYLLAVEQLDLLRQIEEL